MSESECGETTVDFTRAREQRALNRATAPPLSDHSLAPDELVRGNLRALGVDLAAAVAANDHDDQAALLQAVRMIHGRALIMRRTLDDMLGSNMADDFPPLVRVVQRVKQVISDREVDTLAPNELRARMHAVLRVLDHELLTFLEPPDMLPVPEGPDDRVRRA